MYHTQICTDMATKNIAISEDAYERLKALKRPGESFTEVIRRVTGGRGVIELAGALTEKQADELEREVSHVRRASSRRLSRTAELNSKH